MRQIEYCCFANRSGYAQAAQDYVDALCLLNKYDVRVSLLHSNPDQLACTPERFAALRKMMQKTLQPDAIQIYHCIPEMQKRVNQRSATVGFATFETFDPPEHWIHILNQNDAVICPSLFNVQVFKQAGITAPIHYVPHSVNTNLFNPAVKTEKSDKFTFLFLGTWKRRKGWPELFEAWFRTFSASDNVEMLIKTDRLSLSQKNIAELKTQLGFDGKDTAPIKWETRVLNELELPLLFARADCLISPSLGEGFGLPGLQAMAMGIPVAITNYSGPTEYATEATATLIEPNKHIVCSDMDTIPQFRNKKWANVTADGVSQAMQYVVQNVDTVKEKAINAVDDICQRYSHNAVAQQFDRMLESI